MGEGKVSAPRSLLAGLGAGMMEAIFAVTPSETIKCVHSVHLIVSCLRLSGAYTQPAQNQAHRRLEEPEPTFPWSYPWHRYHRTRRGPTRGLPRPVPRGMSISIQSCVSSLSHRNANCGFQMMRQGANSAVRFTTYTTLKQFVQGQGRAGQQLSSVMTFGIGAFAGLITVYTTMPLE